MKKNSAYGDLVVTEPMLNAVIVCNNHGQWFRFQVWADRVFIMNRRLEFRNWADFDDAYNEDTDMEDLHAEYAKWFGKPAPKNAKKVTLTKCIWGKMYLKCEDRSQDYRGGPPKDPVTGKAERRRNLDGRLYRALDGGNDTHLQAQALIVHSELLKRQRVAGRDYLTEAEVRDVMVQAAAAGILKTKQDPFRIFQYYRGALIKASKLENVDA